MERHPDDGMFSIKLVHPGHLNHKFFTPDTSNDGLPRLMNFSDKGNTPAIAARIRPAHRALVYVCHPIQKFVWAIEYTGTVQDGQQAAAACQVQANSIPPEWSKVLLPIRFVATIDVDSAPDAQLVLRQAGVDFTPNAFPMMHISAAAYQKVFDAINWQWIAPIEQIAVKGNR